MSYERTRSRCRDRLDRISRSTTLGVEELRCEVLETLRRAIGFTSSCWQLTDPQSLSPARQGSAAMSMSAATGGELARVRLWEECLGPSGMGDIVTLTARPVWGMGHDPRRPRPRGPAVQRQ